ncbi:carbohydrate ABC transporter permease [Metabacillus sp. BG109]|uniref:Carbohydrate ABC transporter permease n=2 Tax=Metabacillus bambusae TaxID=2795218 RepID=A0ABS3N7V8_9BACI|nr:carbohydrate ABC transporter permease [Metabacillus bambusae]
MLIGVIGVAIFLFPLYWMFITSIKPMNELFVSPPLLFPDNPTWQPYYDNFIADHKMIKYIGNSFIIAIGTTVLTFLLAVPASYALARFNIKGIGFVLILLLAMQMLPTIMLAMPLFVFFAKLNMLNSFSSLILANTTNVLPFAILVLRPFFKALPKGLEEAAEIDGCNKFTTFFKIMLPCIKPGLLTIGVFSFLFSWSDFLFALTLTTDESIRPLTLGMYTFMGEYLTQWNQLMAVATISAVPIIILFIILQNYIVSGITSGAMKD